MCWCWLWSVLLLVETVQKRNQAAFQARSGAARRHFSFWSRVHISDPHRSVRWHMGNRSFQLVNSFFLSPPCSNSLKVWSPVALQGSCQQEAKTGFAFPAKEGHKYFTSFTLPCFQEEQVFTFLKEKITIILLFYYSSLLTLAEFHYFKLPWLQRTLYLCKFVCNYILHRCFI